MITFQQCAFKYSGNEQYSVKDFSLDIHSKTGIVFRRGKSTILKILRQGTMGSCTLGNMNRQHYQSPYGSLLYYHRRELFDVINV